MNLRDAVTSARIKGVRYIQRTNGRTVFDAVAYNPSHLMDEDLYSDDWALVTGSVKYFS